MSYAGVGGDHDDCVSATAYRTVAADLATAIEDAATAWAEYERIRGERLKYAADLATARTQLEGLGEIGVDLCWKATPYGTTITGDVASYILPKGVVHRLIGALQGAGYPAAFRAIETLPEWDDLCADCGHMATRHDGRDSTCGDCPDDTPHRFAAPAPPSTGELPTCCNAPRGPSGVCPGCGSRSTPPTTGPCEYCGGPHNQDDGCPDYDTEVAYAEASASVATPPSGNTDNDEGSDHARARADLATARAQLAAVEALCDKAESYGPGARVVPAIWLRAVLAVVLAAVPDSKEAGE
jgi:hypothetical protein